VRYEGHKSAASGQFDLDLEYRPVGADTEPMFAGKVVSTDTQNYSGFTIEFNNTEAQPPWRSGKVPLNGNGAFRTNLRAEKGRKNIYLIELCDGKGTRRDTSPDRLSYTIGTVPTDPPLIHSVGVALANNRVKWFLEKGTPLPSRRPNIPLKTTVTVRRGQRDEVIRIPVIEGQNALADRNREVGKLEIPGTEIERSLYAKDLKSPHKSRIGFNVPLKLFSGGRTNATNVVPGQSRL